MIISASRRTDIPAFYADWLARRFDDGFCTVPNPFNAHQVARVSLLPEDVDAIVFWTRFATPILPLLDRLDARGFRYYFQYTLTGYGPPVEPSLPPLDKAIEAFRRLAGRLPAGAVVWRYDPILIGSAFPADEHCRRFSAIADALESSTRRVVVSVVHPYRKTKRRLGALYSWGDELAKEPSKDASLPDLLGKLADIAQRHGMVMQACSQEADYSNLGINTTQCVDDRLLAELFGGDWPSRKDPGQRTACRCIPSKDIGMPDTCPFGCVYCYANRNAEMPRRRQRDHDPSSPSLHGRHQPSG